MKLAFFFSRYFSGFKSLMVEIFVNASNVLGLPVFEPVQSSLLHLLYTYIWLLALISRGFVIQQEGTANNKCILFDCTGL